MNEVEHTGKIQMPYNGTASTQETFHRELWAAKDMDGQLVQTHEGPNCFCHTEDRIPFLTTQPSSLLGEMKVYPNGLSRTLQLK